MRSTRKTKAVKNSNVPKNLKKKPRNRSRGIFSWSDDMSGLFLEDLNEVLRENKVRRAECNGSWKVLPKDSCEVYKNRRKRSETNRRKQQNAADSSNYTDSRIEECKSYKRNSRRRQRRRQLPAKRVVVRDKRRKRYHGSESSYSNSSSSMSTTDTSGTEMDYE